MAKFVSCSEISVVTLQALAAVSIGAMLFNYVYWVRHFIVHHTGCSTDHGGRTKCLLIVNYDGLRQSIKCSLDAVFTKYIFAQIYISTDF